MIFSSWVLFAGLMGGPVSTDPPKGPTDLVFCFWNVENLFDDRDDPRNTTDEIYDNPFARDRELRQLKYERIASALLRINGGRGPDIIACVEVESVRSAELLKETLNAKIHDSRQKYQSIAMKNLDAGRHISPCVISRFPLSQIQTRLHGKLLRVLETHLIINGHDLTILTTHWTSKIRRDDGTDGESSRKNYGSTIAAAYTAVLKKKPQTDILVCGDFNDTPDSEPVTKSLRAIGDRDEVKRSAGTARPLLYNLMAGKEPAKYGTLWYDNRPVIYDQICVSAGMLDEQGWLCAPASLQTITDGLIRKGASRRQPWRFADPEQRIVPEDRGYSDHFPLTVKLSVNP